MAALQQTSSRGRKAVHIENLAELRPVGAGEMRRGTDAARGQTRGWDAAPRLDHSFKTGNRCARLTRRQSAARCNCAQERAGTELATPPVYPMLNFFMAGPDLVRSELTALGPNGPYRLIIRHGQGSIVEYFLSSTAALLREAELERLLMCARGANPAQKGVAA